MITNVVAAVAAAGLLAVPADEALRTRALGVLRGAVAAEQRWVKVHAAEALLVAGDGEADRGEVARAFERELAANGTEPQYRIGIWRVLAESARDDRSREPWVRRIADAFFETGGPDRLHASETLGKLGYRPNATEAEAFESAARGGASPIAANALWVLANGGRLDAEGRLAGLLAAGDAGTRATAAYAVRHFRAVSSTTWQKLTAALGAERSPDVVRASLAAAAFVQAPDSQRPAFRFALEQLARANDPDVRSEVCGALAAAGDATDLPLLTTLLDDATVDVRVGAARAILQIGGRGRQ
jgi:SSS family solute:Na+ symporter